ncbi:hypothetical protein HNO88_001657 [Novosphingobium chloroacetimidivorans]|uniref:DUF3253 domain-containing protein n=1 Tax=Novosphingobium chloroacetimidivorans TaxID=1428314 RepID=A0A7W7NV95_9SPHN|nr:DUF3253 domain-containing protein [Novosphingobium chloroacetimidivorans]MBB4858338.1 hypothetical protein [Novosphingobium chloroacetimidivorans]
MAATGIDDARAGLLSLLVQREAGATICPSEVARLITAEGAATHWREAMPLVHAAVDGLIADGLVRLSWKGQDMPTRSGPYRIRVAQMASDGLQVGSRSIHSRPSRASSETGEKRSRPEPG